MITKNFYRQKVSSMRIIDFHTHIYPDAIALKAADSICKFYELDGGGMNGTVSSLLERGAQAGISRYVVLPVGLKPDHVRHINEFIIGMWKSILSLPGLVPSMRRWIISNRKWSLSKGRDFRA